MPPACFPKLHLPKLMSLSGDQGAKALLSKIPDSGMVKTSPDILRDVDTLADLNRLSTGAGPALRQNRVSLSR